MGKGVILILFLVVVLGLIIYLMSWVPGFFKDRVGGFSLAPSFYFPTSTSSAPGWYPTVGRFEAPRVYPLPTYGQSTYGQSTYTDVIPDSVIPAGSSRAQLSSYFGWVKISPSPSYFGTSAQIRLYTYFGGGAKVNITGWKIQGNRWGTVVPQAINYYDYTGLASESDIIVSGNSSVNMYGGQSTIGKNLRLNRCIGFLENSNRFNPSLPRSCPAIVSRNQIVNLSGFCQNYILSLGSCQLPSDSFINSLPPTNEGYMCQQFLRTVNARSCWDEYSNDSDFLSNDWMLWIGSIGLDPLHDVVRLFDKQGLLVDQLVY